MIDRKTFWTVMGFVSAMLAAAAWRISTLPDWTHLPRYGANGVAIAPINSAVLLVPPGGVVFSLIIFFAFSRISVGSDDALKPHRKWLRLSLIFVSAISAMGQTVVIARSLGLFLAMNPILFSRATLVAGGLLQIIFYNAAPKMPWLRSRVAFLDLDPDSGAKLRRFQGWLGVLLGLVMMLGGLFLPIKLMSPVAFSLTAAFLAAVMVFRFSVKRGQPEDAR